MDYRIGRRHLWRDTWNETSGEVDGDFAPDSFSDPMEFGRSTEGPNDAFLALVRTKKNSQLFGFNFGAAFFFQRRGPNDVLEGRRAGAGKANFRPKSLKRSMQFGASLACPAVGLG